MALIWYGCCSHINFIVPYHRDNFQVTRFLYSNYILLIEWGISFAISKKIFAIVKRSLKKILKSLRTNLYNFNLCAYRTVALDNSALFNNGLKPRFRNVKESCLCYYIRDELLLFFIINLIAIFLLSTYNSNSRTINNTLLVNEFASIINNYGHWCAYTIRYEFRSKRQWKTFL